MSTSPTTSQVPMRRRRWTASILAIVFVFWLALVSFIWRAMHKPPEEFARVMSHMPWEIFLVLPFETLWTRARAGSLHLGDSAPDFSLLKVDKSAAIKLSEVNAKQPVVMVFGSYT